MTKKVIILGAGPAGLGAAYQLAGKSGLEVKLIDQGKSALERRCPSPDRCITKCKACDKGVGVGGAGTFSDGKFVFESIIGKRIVGSNLFENIGREKELDYIIRAKDFFTSHGLEMVKVDPERMRKAREIEVIAARNDMDYIFSQQAHMGTDKLPEYITKIETDLKSKGIEIITREKVMKFNSQRIFTEKREMEYDYLIVAPGRKGADWLEIQLNENKLNYSHRAVDIGFRVETDANVVNHLTDIARDLKLSMMIPAHGYNVRTFCACPNGVVTRETYDHFNLVNGASDSRSMSPNTNFALLVSVPLEGVNSNDYGDAIAKLFRRTGTDKPVLQQYGDIKAGRRSKESKMYEWRIQPTLKDVHVGSVGWAMPYDIQSILVQATEKLSVPRLMEGLNQASTLFYAPELKRNGLNVMTDEYMRTNVPQIRVAGDAAGKSRSINGAAASGILAADGILKDYC